jgi:hypothetical protein
LWTLPKGPTGSSVSYCPSSKTHRQNTSNLGRCNECRVQCNSVRNSSSLFSHFKSRISLLVTFIPAFAPNTAPHPQQHSAPLLTPQSSRLAVAAGYEVITTSSPQNFSLVKKLGASQVFDYRSRTVIPDIIAAFRGKTTAGALTMGTGAAEACLDILNKCKGDKFISMASYPLPDPPPTTFVMPRTVIHFMSKKIEYAIKSKTRGIGLGTIFASTLVGNGVGKAMYVDFLPNALENGSYVAAPEPEVVGRGLEFVNRAFEVQKKGVRAKKVVVSLP